MRMKWGKAVDVGGAKTIRMQRTQDETRRTTSHHFISAWMDIDLCYEASVLRPCSVFPLTLILCDKLIGGMTWFFWEVYLS